MHLAAASDAPVAPPEPLTSIRAAVTRRDATGQVISGEALAADIALALHTRGAAAAAGVSGERGQIKAGMSGDLVVLSGNPEAADTRVEMTIFGGRVVWQRG